MLHGHPIHADIVYSHTGYDVTSYFHQSSQKTAANAACDGFGSNFSGAAFCLPHQLVGFLFSLEISSAFDPIDHKIQLSGLHTSFWMHGLPLILKLGNSRSAWIILLNLSACAVPQDFVLIGPILFHLTPFPLPVRWWHTTLCLTFSPQPWHTIAHLRSCISALSYWFLHNGIVLPDFLIHWHLKCLHIIRFHNFPTSQTPLISVRLFAATLLYREPSELQHLDVEFHVGAGPSSWNSFPPDFRSPDDNFQMSKKTHQFQQTYTKLWTKLTQLTSTTAHDWWF